MRAALVEAAEQLIRDEGYPAVTARTLGEKVNLTRQIVHYYFHTMDDVFIAVIRRNAERWRARLEEAGRATQPLRALQVLNREASQAILSIELYALANRRPAVRAEVVAAAKQARNLQTKLLAEHLRQRGITPGLPPIVATVLLTSLAQALALEAAIDIDTGHRETLRFVDLCLSAFAAGQTVPFPSVAPAEKTTRKARVRPSSKSARITPSPR